MKYLTTLIALCSLNASVFHAAYGLWDVPELYDTESDPHELRGLFNAPDHHQRALDMDKRLFELLAETGGDSIPLMRGWKGRAKELRQPDVSQWVSFPASMTTPSGVPLKRKGVIPK